MAAPVAATPRSRSSSGPQPPTPGPRRDERARRRSIGSWSAAPQTDDQAGRWDSRRCRINLARHLDRGRRRRCGRRRDPNATRLRRTCGAGSDRAARALRAADPLTRPTHRSAHGSCCNRVGAGRVRDRRDHAGVTRRRTRHRQPRAPTSRQIQTAGPPHARILRMVCATHVLRSRSAGSHRGHRDRTPHPRGVVATHHRCRGRVRCARQHSPDGPARHKR